MALGLVKGLKSTGRYNWRGSRGCSKAGNDSAKQQMISRVEL